jgi:hypothetical protein
MRHKAKKTIYHDIEFDSIGESERYAELEILQRAGHISQLHVHKKFILQNPFVCHGKNIRAIIYECDFYYYDKEKEYFVIEDFKGAKAIETDKFKMKWKMLKSLYRDTYIYLKTTKKRGRIVPYE